PWPWGNNAIIEARRSAKAFVDRFTDDDEIALVSFSGETYYNQSWTNNRTLVKQKIDGLNVRSGTALWDAVLTSANLIQYRTKKKVMVVLADGQDGSSDNPASLAIDYAINAGCVVYTIGLGNEIDVPNMTTLATRTGGKYYQAPSTADLDNIYAEIINQLETTGICELNYRSPIDCWNGDEVSIEVEASTPGGLAMGGATYRLPYDTTTFSYVNLAMGRDHVVEAGEEITIPVELTRVTALRAPSSFDFSVDFDPTLLQLITASTDSMTDGFTITTTPTLRGSDVSIVGGRALDTPGPLCTLTFRAAETFESRKVEIGVSPPDVQQFCTVASSNDGRVTISGSCERALLQGASTLTNTHILSTSPNPFPSATTITYRIAAEESVRLTVFDMMGREVALLLDDARRPAGDHSVSFNASGLPSGMYLVKLSTPTANDAVHVILSK
ncbi:MAG: VWA domain-containing protein, partial [Bacteroidota bacterium]|nr:VWA domain-containing protein [Bacteroidota bacterium]